MVRKEIMGKAPAMLIAAACVASVSVSAQQHPPHQHGVAHLEVVVDGATLSLRLESPLDSLVGFESAPRTEPQRKAVREMAARFRRPQDLFAPTAAAGCSPGAVSLSSEAIEPALLGEHAGAAAPDSGQAGSGHADLDVEIRFDCARPQALKGMDVLLFKAFPGLHRIDAALVTPKGQGGAQLSADRTLLAW